KQAESLSEYLLKGRQVYVEGRLQSRKVPRCRQCDAFFPDRDFRPNSREKMRCQKRCVARNATPRACPTSRRDSTFGPIASRSSAAEADAAAVRCRAAAWRRWGRTRRRLRRKRPSRSPTTISPSEQVRSLKFGVRTRFVLPTSNFRLRTSYFELFLSCLPYLSSSLTTSCSSGVDTSKMSLSSIAVMR